MKFYLTKNEIKESSQIVAQLTIVQLIQYFGTNPIKSVCMKYKPSTYLIRNNQDPSYVAGTKRKFLCRTMDQDPTGHFNGAIMWEDKS